MQYWESKKSKIQEIHISTKSLLKVIFKENLTFFISNILQESITKTDIIASLSSQHSLTPHALKLDKNSERGRGLWKFSNSLLSDEDFVLKMKGRITMSIETLNRKYIRWFDEIRIFKISNQKILYSLLSFQN